MNERSFLFIMDMVRTQGKKNLQGVVKVLVFFLPCRIVSVSAQNDIVSDPIL